VRLEITPLTAEGEPASDLEFLVGFGMLGQGGTPHFDVDYSPFLALWPVPRAEGGVYLKGETVAGLNVENGVAVRRQEGEGAAIIKNVSTSDPVVVRPVGLGSHSRGVAVVDGSQRLFSPAEGIGESLAGQGEVGVITRLLVTSDVYGGPPFDGSFEDRAVADFISYQRRDSSEGTWVTLATGLDPEESITDYTPRLVAPEYRIISHTTLPSSSTGETVVVEWEHRRDPIFVNSGPDYALVCSAMGGEATDEPEIEQSSTVFEGVPMPVAIFGDTEHHEVTFSGIIHPLLVTEEGVSTREEWLELLRERQVVCYRDCQGRKIYGLLNLSFSQDRLVETINLSVAQVWHEEGVRQ
ncbi:MAG TPA: hypothetical protein VK054_01750, partial [Beutenbergiaceae bacterium]|nr:hypothetical protein [Beutenbergiaceae bacterium]